MGGALSEPARERRRYDSPLRRQRAAETRDRIVASGAEILRDFPVWNWHALTVRAVAERAGVNVRTVYRYFATERELRDAVMTRLEAEAGVDLNELRLGNLREVTVRLLEYVSSYPLEPRAPHDPTLVDANERQRAALLAAVSDAAGDLTEPQRSIVAAMLDVLWSVASYERLVAGWRLDPGEAISGVTWVMGLIEDAVARGQAPTPER
jgi:AcrR family transcriptional regulator